MNIRFRLDGFTDMMKPYIELYGILGMLHYKSFSISTNEDGSSTREYEIRCAKPTIRKMKRVKIVDTNGKEIDLEVWDAFFLDMGNGHKFITGKVHEQPKNLLLDQSDHSK
jgi:hypothetical protein